MKRCAVFLTLLLSQADAKLNVLYLLSDDLRVDLNKAYGQTHMVTPNFDRLADDGLTFGRAYAQQAVCAASRTSFMTGRRPQRTRNYGGSENGKDDFRNAGIGGKEWITMPEHFKNQGYITLGAGKTFHKGLDGKVNKQGFDLPTSWSSNWPTGKDYTYYKFEYSEKDSPGKKKKCEETGTMHVSGMDGYFHDDEKNSSYYDYGLADQAIAMLEDYAKYCASNNASSGTVDPFFFMVGFARPHAPWRVPTRFYNLYKDLKTLASNKLPYEGMPHIAFRTQGAYDEHGTCVAPHMDKAIPDDAALEWRRHYYAAVSFVDEQVGRILDALEKNNLADSTIVVMHSDHGWQLGENGIWHKQTNFELAARVPLIIKVPDSSSAGKRTESLAELVDVYPTLAELTGIEKPSDLDGVSLASLFEEPSTKIKTHAFYQFPHSMGDSGEPNARRLLSPRDGPESLGVSKSDPCQKHVMGFTVRSEQYRYTRWMPFGNTSLSSKGKDLEMGCVDWEAAPCAEELYDHSEDDGIQLDKIENENVNGSHPDVVADHLQLLKDEFTLCTCGGPSPSPPPPPSPPSPPSPGPSPTPSPCQGLDCFERHKKSHCGGKYKHSGDEDLESCANLCSENKKCICFDHAAAGSSEKYPACRWSEKDSVKSSGESYTAYTRKTVAESKLFIV